MTEICVIMSTYNGSAYIAQQIESILAQELCDIHLHVRDDGSSDSTVDILKAYERQGKLTLHQGENLGPAYSFLQLLKDAGSYDYYAFADQDDIWYKDKLIHGVRRLEGQNVPALCYGNAELMNADGEMLNVCVYRRYHPEKKNTIACVGALLGCTIVFNKKLAKLIQKFPLPCKLRMHDYYMAQVCIACGGRIFYEDYVGMGYRQHSNNVIGMKHSKKDILKQRFHDIIEVRDPSVVDQAAEICKIYSAFMDDENKRLFAQIAHYRDSFKNQVLLCRAFDGSDVSKSMRIKYKLMILFGKL